MLPERAHNEEARKRFVREAKAASALSNEHVCRLYEVGELESSVPFLVMEFLVGSTLEQILFNSGTPAVDVVVDWALQSLEGLADAHEAGFVHRDIKPENIFLHEPDGLPPIVKILDFGAVKDMSAHATRLTRTGSTMGSPAYMPPEQVRAEEIDQRADVWAMAVTIYELLSGKLPFGGESVPQTLAAILRENPIPIRHHRKDVPVEASRRSSPARSRRTAPPATRTRPRCSARSAPCGRNPDAADVERYADALHEEPAEHAAAGGPLRCARRNDGHARGDLCTSTIVPEDPSHVRERPRIVINERGHVITVAKKTPPSTARSCRSSPSSSRSRVAFASRASSSRS